MNGAKTAGRVLDSLNRIRRFSVFVGLMMAMMAGHVSSLLGDVQVLPLNAVWSYQQGTNLDGTGWPATAFNDTNWPAGNALLYVENNISVSPRNTPLTIGSSAYYFRTHFSLAYPPTNVLLIFSARIDDGAVFYLNGTEVRRVRMVAAPAPVFYTNLATATPTTGDAVLSDTFTLVGASLTNLVLGDNVLAVEVHQNVTNSDDIVFGSSLTVRFTNSPPVLLQQPTNLAVLDGRSAALTAVVDGQPAPLLQWFKDGVALSAATNATLSLPAAYPTNAGAYWLTASNVHGVAVTTNALLAVLPDTNAPVITAAVAQKSLTNVSITFSEPVAAALATNLANYEIYQTIAPSNRLNLVRASLGNSSNVVLVTDPRTAGAHYTLSVTGICDTASVSNYIAPGTTQPLSYQVDLLAVDALTQWKYSQAGALPATNWAAADFDDAAWPSGAAIFHAGSPFPGAADPVRTTLSLTAGSNVVNAYYFRTVFNLPGIVDTNSLRLHDIADDGAVFYLNGSEAFSIGMPAARPVAYATTASRSVGTANYEPAITSPGAAFSGTALLGSSNVLAAEVHQHFAGYSDVAFAANLDAVISHYHPALSWTAPVQVPEGAGTLTNQARLSIVEPLLADLVIQLTSSSPSDLTLPAFVTIPAGATNVVFDLVVAEDALHNGSRTVTLVAQAPEGRPAVAVVQVLDNDNNPLSVIAPTAISETNISFQAEVRAAHPVSGNITVALSSGDPSELTVPASVVIPNGATSAVFQVTVVDDVLLDGPQTASLTASVLNWTAGQTTVVVNDNEPTNLIVQLPLTVVEGAGVVTNQARVQLGGIAVSNLSVTLSSGTPGRLTVSSNLTVLTGQSNAVFDLTLIDNTVYESPQPITISAAASGFTAGSNTLIVLNDDAHHFAFGPVPSPQYTNLPVTISVRALNAAGQVETNFNRSTQLSASGQGGAVTLVSTNIGVFTNGLWTGLIQCLTVDRFVRLQSVEVPGLSEPFHVEGAPYRVIGLAAQELIWDAGRQLLYASVPDSGGAYSNTVTAINPATGAILFSVPVGPIPPTGGRYRPGRMALSDDGQFLYVAVSNALAVQRVNLVTQTPGPVFPVGVGQIGILSVADLVVLPGFPASVAVARADSYNAHGVAIYDNGVRRPNTTFEFDSADINSLEPSYTNSILLGYNNQNTGFHLSRVLVDTNGATVLDTTNALLTGFDADITYKDGLLFGSYGGVVNPMSRSLLGTFSVESSFGCCKYVAPDPALGRAFFLSQVGLNAHLQGHDLATFLPLKSFELPGGGKNLVRWGTNGLAFISGGMVCLVQSSLLFPADQPANLTVSQTNASGNALIGSNLTINVSVTNAGPETAMNVTLTNTLPLGVTFLSSAVSQGTRSNFTAGISCNFGMLPPGSNAVLSLVVRPVSGGWITNRAVAIANELDTNLADNISVTVTSVGFVGAPNTVREVNVPTTDLAYATNTGQFYLSIPTSAGALGDKLFPFDPNTGSFGAPILQGEAPQRLAMAPDSSFLYVATRTNRSVRRIALPGVIPDLEFALSSTITSMAVEDMEVMPDDPDALVVLRTPNGFSAEVAIYDQGVPRANAAPSQSDYYSEILELAQELPLAFVQNHGVGGLWRYSMDASGVKLLDSSTTTLTTVDLEWGDGLLYTSLGRAIDPTNSTILGQIPAITSASLVTYDKVGNRLFFLTPNGTTNLLRAIDPVTWVELGSQIITNGVGTPTSLVRWGKDGLAFRTTAGQLFIVRTSLIPSGQPADLAVSGVVSSNLTLVNSNFTYTITVTNLGPNSASNVIAFHRLPSTVAFVSSSASAGTPAVSNNLVTWMLGTLTNGGSASIVVTARTAVGGFLDSTASVVSDAVDPDYANNADRLAVQAIFALAPNSAGQVVINVRDIAFNPLDGKIYAGGGGNQISILNPYSGFQEAGWPLPSPPGILRLSTDNVRLYCSLNSGMSVACLNTLDGSLSWMFPLDTAIRDIEPMASPSASFVLSRASPNGASFGIVQVCDGTNARPQSTHDSSGARDLEFGVLTNTVYAVGNALSGGSRYRVMAISSNGISESAWNESVPFGLDRLEFDGDLLYSAAGEILDPPTGFTVGKFPGPAAGSQVRPEIARQRVYFLNKTNTAWRLQSYEPRTAALIGSVTVSNVLGAPLNLHRWGQDGFAFNTSSNQLFLLRTDLVPSGPNADLSLGQTVDSTPAFLGSNATFVVSVTNNGPNAVSNVLVFGRVPSNSVFISSSVSQGTVTQAVSLLTASLGALTNGGTAQVQLTVRATVGGNLAHWATVTGDNLDPVLANNTSSLDVPVQLNLAPNSSGVIALNTSDLAYDPFSGLIYASLANYTTPPYQNALISIDPATGQLGEPIPVGASLSKLAITDDGSRLYVLANGNTEFRRVSLTSRSVELAVAGLSSNTQDINAAPGLPETLVVALYHGGVRVYDNDTQRTNSLLWFDQVEFYAPDQMLGFWRNSVPTVAARLVLTNNGPAVVSPWAYDLIDGDMSASGGIIYTSGGSAFDPIALTKLRSFGVSGPVAPDSSIDRVAFLTGSSSNQVLRLFDTHNLLQWGALSISNIAGTTDRLIRCGGDRYAFRTTAGQVFIVRSSDVPTGTPAELALGTTPNNHVATIGQPVELLLSVTNYGPNAATNLTVTNALPPGMELLSSTASHGMTTLTNRELRWQVTDLEIGAIATNWVALLPSRSGIFAGITVLRSAARDTNSLNNVTLQTWLINPAPANLALAQSALRAADLIWEPASQRLVVSLPGDAPAFSNSVATLDPLTGLFEAPFTVGPNPGRLAATANGQYLYVGLNATASVARVDLPNRSVNLTFPLNTGYDARDMVPIPGQTGTIAIAREFFPDAGSGMGQAAGVALYKDGVELPLSTAAYVDSVTTLTGSTNPARLYGYNGWTSEFGFRQLDVTTNGVSQLSATGALISGFDRRIHFDSGLVFASSGAVLQPEALTLVTNLPDISADALCKPDVASGKLNFLTQKSGAWFLRQYSHSNYALLREIRIPGVLGQPKSLVRWGADGLAFLTSSNQMFLTRPSAAVMDLSLQHTTVPNQALAGQAFQISLALTNAGPSFEADAVVTNTLPAQTVLLSAQASQGTNSIAGGKVIFSLGALPPGAIATLTLTLQPTNASNVTFTNTAVGTGAFLDSNLANNAAMVLFAGKADTDRDGLPDDWELARGLNATNALDAALDSDCDGTSNLQEYVDGTGPLHFDDLCLSASGLDAQGNLQLALHLQPGKFYTLETSSDLVVWTKVTSFFGLDFNQTVTALRNPAVPVGYFRLRTDTNSPQPLLRLVNGPVFGTNAPLLEITAPPGRNCSLQSSTNLVQWVDVTNYVGSACSTFISDPVAGSQLRFYRVLMR